MIDKRQDYQDASLSLELSQVQNQNCIKLQVKKDIHNNYQKTDEINFYQNSKNQDQEISFAEVNFESNKGYLYSSKLSK